MPISNPLSGRGKRITYRRNGNRYDVDWGNTSFNLDNRIISDIRRNFFLTHGKKYPLGAGQTAPMNGGLGRYIQTHHCFTPKYASAIAAVMVDIGIINVKPLPKRPIYLYK